MRLRRKWYSGWVDEFAWSPDCQSGLTLRAADKGAEPIFELILNGLIVSWQVAGV